MRNGKTLLSPEMERTARLAALGAEILIAVKNSGLARPKRRRARVPVRPHKRSAPRVRDIAAEKRAAQRRPVEPTEE